MLKKKFKFNFLFLVFHLPFKDHLHCMEVALYEILEGYCLQSCWELLGIDSFQQRPTELQVDTPQGSS